MEHVDVAIVGGGISGLSIAWFLKEKGANARVLEKSSRPGGVIQTQTSDGFLFEHGPNSLMGTSDSVLHMIDEIGLSDRIVEASENAKKRFVLRDQVLHQVPTGPLQFITSSLLSFSGKLRVLAEPFIGRSDPEVRESVAEFACRRFGLEALDYLVNPFVGGIYAGRPGELGVRYSLEKLWALEQEYGSVIYGAIRSGSSGKKSQAKGGEGQNSDPEVSVSGMFSFDDGLQVLPRALRRELGDSFRSQTEVERIELQSGPGGPATLHLNSTGGDSRVLETDRLVLSVPAGQIPELLQVHRESSLRRLKKIPYASVAVVFFGYIEDPCDDPPEGFGFLVPRVEERNILGTLWNSSIFPGRAPEGGAAFTTFVGGTRQPELLNHSNEELVNLVQEELEQIMGLASPPDRVWIKRWSRAIPQYLADHSQVIKAIRSFEENHPYIYIEGNFREGVSVPSRIQAGQERAEEIYDDLEG